mgnify:CR=1 FL=1|jgi:hypothetical protein
MNIIKGILKRTIPTNNSISIIKGILSRTFGDKVSSATPVSSMFIYDGSSNIELPIYALADIINNQFRVSCGSGLIGCFEMVDTSDSNASNLRIYNGSEIKAVKKI